MCYGGRFVLPICDCVVVGMYLCEFIYSMCAFPYACIHSCMRAGTYMSARASVMCPCMCMYVRVQESWGGMENTRVSTLHPTH